jgi:hypothetical protein
LHGPDQLRGLHRRASEFRHALRQRGGGGAPPSAAVIACWQRFLCDVHLALRPAAANPLVRRGDLCRSDGSAVVLACDDATLALVEALLDVPGGGCCAVNPAFCAWLRDLLDPVQIDPGNL